MLNKLKVLLVALVSFNSFAVMFLDIEVTHEKGLGKKMILKSELMSRERVQSGKAITLQMKNGIKVTLEAKFKEESDEIGPSSVVEIGGTLSNLSGAEAEKNFKLIVKINNVGKLEIKDDQGQKTSIKVTPKVK
jgi:hypothetical protein